MGLSIRHDGSVSVCLIAILAIAGCQGPKIYYESDGLGEVAERAAIARKVGSHYYVSDFETLEGIARQFRESGARTPSGVPMLGRFYDGIADAMPQTTDRENRWNELIGFADKWIETYPESPTPYLAKARVLHQYAWTFRGRGFANEVGAENRAKYLELLTVSREVLAAAEPIVKSSPAYYAFMINLHRSLPVTEEAFKSLLEEGLNKFPEYDDIYFAAASYLSPAWRGSPEAVKALAEEALERTKATRGHEMYARIYWATPRLSRGFLFQDPSVRWNLIVMGMDEIAARYPDQWNIQHFALFACAKSDPVTLTRMFDQVQEPALIQAWTHIDVFRNCKDWYESVGDQVRQSSSNAESGN